MGYEVYLTETFLKSIKVLKRKYRKVKDDIAGTVRALEEDPTIGDSIPGWSKEIWKVRTASSDVKKGKRGGFRSIYLWEPGAGTVYMLYSHQHQQSKTQNSKSIIAFQRPLGQCLDKLEN